MTQKFKIGDRVVICGAILGDLPGAEFTIIDTDTRSVFISSPGGKSFWVSNDFIKLKESIISEGVCVKSYVTGVIDTIRKTNLLILSGKFTNEDIVDTLTKVSKAMERLL